MDNNCKFNNFPAAIHDAGLFCKVIRDNKRALLVATPKSTPRME